LKAQLTLTVQESKSLIAEAIASLPQVKRALENGKVFLKGGSTVSALSEKLVNMPLWVSGRITPRGAKHAKYEPGDHPHQILIESGRVVKVRDDIICDVVKGLGKGDAIVIGANAIDFDGNTAMMIGAPLGGGPGPAFTGIMTEGADVIVAAGLEKLIPNSIREAVLVAGRKAIDVAYGIPVGLAPIVGRLVTEKEACEILGGVKCTVIGCGGIFGAEGATTMIIEGAEQQVQKVLKIVESVKCASLTGVKESLAECDEENCEECEHIRCVYRTEVCALRWLN